MKGISDINRSEEPSSFLQLPKLHPMNDWRSLHSDEFLGLLELLGWITEVLNSSRNQPTLPRSTQNLSFTLSEGISHLQGRMRCNFQALQS